MVALTRIAALAGVLLVSGVSQAQLADCQPLGTGSQAYKVVMDELSFASAAAASGAGAANLRQLLSFNLTTQLAEFERAVATQAGSPVVDLQLVTCAGRKPSLEGTEFTPQRIETLSDQRVVVELWGTLLERSGAGAGGPHAMIGYIIPPILLQGSAAQAPARFLIRYPKTDGGSTDVLHKLPEVSAFALLGLAVKAQKARRYDLAVWAFGQSQGVIDKEWGEGDAAQKNALLAYATSAACQTRNSARGDAQYHGTIRVTPTENCAVSP